MNFVYFGYDHMLPAVRRLLADGHGLCGIFTFQCDNVFNFNIETIALGQNIGVPVSLSRPEAADIERFIEQGCEVFIAAGFPAKIPVPEEGRAYAINLHPSLLPKGRGMMPTPTIIMHEPEAAGFTIHKMTARFDAGDILYQEPLPLAVDETVDSYAARVCERGTEALSKVMANLPKYWAKAAPQDESTASTFPMPTDEMRTIAWGADIAAIDKTARAFGSFGCIGEAEGQLLVIYALETQAQHHEFDPGRIVEQDDKTMVIAAPDGLVRLTKFDQLA